MTIDFQKVADAIEKAPEGIKNLMFSVELGDKLFEIATTNGITEEEQYLQMVDEVGYVILGLKEKSSFVDSLVQIGIEKSVAESISKKVEMEVFSKIDRKIDKETENKTQKVIEKKDLIIRTEEIAKKYSLNQSQTDKLINIVTSAVVESKNPEMFLETIVTELGISRLLAEQIMEDLEVRVFEYALKTIQNQEKKGESIEKIKDDDLPELRPEITPMVEPEEKVRVRPVPVGFAGATPKPQIPKPELVQRPVSVPRYTAVPMEEEGSNQEPVASSKENVPHQSVSGPQASTSPQPVPEPVKKYAVDPYREPLE